MDSGTWMHEQVKGCGVWGECAYLKRHPSRTLKDEAFGSFLTLLPNDLDVTVMETKMVFL